MLMAANPQALTPGPLMVSMGLTSLVFAALMLYRGVTSNGCSPTPRSSTWAIATFAFGMGGPLAQFRRAAAHDHAPA